MGGRRDRREGTTTAFGDAGETAALLTRAEEGGRRGEEYSSSSSSSSGAFGVTTVTRTVRRVAHAVSHPIFVACCVVLSVLGAVYYEEAGSAETGAYVKVAHEIWLGSEVPGVKRMIFDRNKKILENEGWTMKLWTEGDISSRYFPMTNAVLERGRAYHQLSSSNVYSMLVDLMKYEVLYQHGGLYLDTNVELFRGVDALFQKTAKGGKEVFMVKDPGDSRFYSAGILGAVAPGARVFHSLLNNTEWLDNIDFGKRCIANAVTGPVWLSHQIREEKLEDTIETFEREVAYPLGCGENEFDVCVKHITDDDAKSDPRLKWMMDHSAVDGRDLSGHQQSFTRYVAQTWKRVTSGSGAWNPLELSHALVQEADGTYWNVTLPCETVFSRYPNSFAIDHFSFHGASWQEGCTAKERQSMVLDWLEKQVPPNEDLLHKWSMSFVRMLSAPAPTSSLIAKVRLHESQGVYKKARLLLASSSLRSGATLLGEALATTLNHPVNSTMWEREGFPRTDSYFANFINLGDWWSVEKLPKENEDTWRSRLRAYLLQIGVKESTIDASLSYPGEFVNEVQSRAWEAGIDNVYASVIGASVHADAKHVSRSAHILHSILEASNDDALLLRLRRHNKLDMYASTLRASEGIIPFQQIREDAEPFDAENITARERSDATARLAAVRFNAKAFDNFLRVEASWDRATSHVPEKQTVVDIEYEQHLSTSAALQDTISRLRDEFGLDLNEHALSLLKLERVSDYVDARDFADPLPANARVFLRRDRNSTQTQSTP